MQFGKVCCVLKCQQYSNCCFVFVCFLLCTVLLLVRTETTILVVFVIWIAKYFTAMHKFYKVKRFYFCKHILLKPFLHLVLCAIASFHIDSFMTLGIVWTS